jgi:hypothetical protein
MCGKRKEDYPHTKCMLMYREEKGKRRRESKGDRENIERKIDRYRVNKKKHGRQGRIYLHAQHHGIFAADASLTVYCARGGTN